MVSIEKYRGVWYNRPGEWNMRDNIKRRWAWWRRAQGVSQARVAHMCGVSRSTAQRWEDGTCPSLPDVAQMAMIAAGLRLRPGAVLDYLSRDWDAIGSGRELR